MNEIKTIKTQLIEEISSNNINILKIREICRDNPGLIASAGLRIKIWTILLLGNSIIKDDVGLINSYELCGEMNVLEADVRRTRSSIDKFKSTSWRRGLTDILQVFCVTHKIQYKQGMNEVAAPFLYLNPPPNGEGLSYVLFEAFVFRYLENFFCRDESTYLFKAFRLFHLLLVFVDPQLAHHLEEQHFLPELYSPQWFLTLYSRGLELPLVLRLWDMMIAVDDPAFTFFVGLALLRKLKDELLRADSSDIPEIISRMSIQGEKGVDELVILALQLYRNTPRCFIRYLRVCCVKTPELTPLPPIKTWEYVGNDLLPQYITQNENHQKKYHNKEFDELVFAYAMSRQSVRQTLMLSPSEFISILFPISSPQSTSSDQLPMFSNHNSRSNSSESGIMSLESDNTTQQSLPSLSSSPITTSPSPKIFQSFTMNQMVVLDIRSTDEIQISGGGSLPIAMHIEPEFLDHPDALERWLEHFDTMKGLPICIIDTPPINETSSALWKRLLLGHGDGLGTESIQYGTYSNRNNNTNNNHSSTNNNNKHFFKYQPIDNESPFREVEKTAMSEDNTRVGIKLASILQSHQFPYVMILDGGYPALISQIFHSRGMTESLIINYDEEKWLNYLVTINKKENFQTDLQYAKNYLLKIKQLENNNNNNNRIHTNNKNQNVHESELEQARIALNVAIRLGHTHMREILELKIQKLENNC